MQNTRFTTMLSLLGLTAALLWVTPLWAQGSAEDLVQDSSQAEEGPGLSKRADDALQLIAWTFEPYERRLDEILASAGLPIPDELADAPDNWASTPFRGKMIRYATAAEAATRANESSGGADAFLAWAIRALGKEFPGPVWAHVARAFDMTPDDHQKADAFAQAIQADADKLFLFEEQIIPSKSYAALTLRQRQTIDLIERVAYGARGLPSDLISLATGLDSGAARDLVSDSISLTDAFSRAIMAKPEAERDAVVDRLGRLTWEYVLTLRSPNWWADPSIHQLASRFANEDEKALLTSLDTWLGRDDPGQPIGDISPRPGDPGDGDGESELPRTADELRDAIRVEHRIAQAKRDPLESPETPAFQRLEQDLLRLQSDPRRGAAIRRELAGFLVTHLRRQERSPTAYATSAPRSLPSGGRVGELASDSGRELITRLIEASDASVPTFDLVAPTDLPSLRPSDAEQIGSVAQTWRVSSSDLTWDTLVLHDAEPSTAGRPFVSAPERARAKAAHQLLTPAPKDLPPGRAFLAATYDDLVPLASGGGPTTPYGRLTQGGRGGLGPSLSRSYLATAGRSVPTLRLLGITGGVAVGAEPTIAESDDPDETSRIDIRALRHNYDSLTGEVTLDLVDGEDRVHHVGTFSAALVFHAARFAASDRRLLYTMIQTDWSNDPETRKLVWLHLAHPAIEGTTTEYRFSALDTWADAADTAEKRIQYFRAQAELHYLYVFACAHLRADRLDAIADVLSSGADALERRAMELPDAIRPVDQWGDDRHLDLLGESLSPAGRRDRLHDLIRRQRNRDSQRHRDFWRETTDVDDLGRYDQQLRDLLQDNPELRELLRNNPSLLRDLYPDRNPLGNINDHFDQGTSELRARRQRQALNRQISNFRSVASGYRKQAESARIELVPVSSAAASGLRWLAMTGANDGPVASLLSKNLAYYDERVVAAIYSCAESINIIDSEDDDLLDAVAANLERALGATLSTGPDHVDQEWINRNTAWAHRPMNLVPAAELAPNGLSMVYEPNYPLALDSYTEAARPTLFRFAARIPFSSEPVESPGGITPTFVTTHPEIFAVNDGFELDLTPDVLAWICEQSPAVQQIYTECQDFVLMQRIIRASLDDRFSEDFDFSSVWTLIESISDVGGRNFLPGRVVWTVMSGELPAEAKAAFAESLDSTRRARDPDGLNWLPVPSGSDLPPRLRYKN